MHHRRTFFSIVLATFLIHQTEAKTVAKEPRWNVLWIMADDLNNQIGCYGDTSASTPHLDALARSSMRFDRAYCAFPLCGPSRNAMLTGLYPNSTGILSNSQIFRQTIPKHISLPQAFRREGYWVVRAGKMYHYNVPNSIGTDGHDDPASWEVEFNPSGVDRNKEHSKIFSLKEREFGGTLSWLASDHPEPLHTDALLAEDAIWALQRCSSRPDHPFFLSVGFFRPHTPYVAPKEYFKKHPLDQILLVSDIAADQEDIPQPALASAKPEQLSMTDQQRREALQAYRASISFMDAQVGKVLAALESSGLADRTIVVFTSDHGYHTGEHGLWQKMSLFEESARVPLLIRVPGWTDQGTVSTAPVSHIDLYPTMLELASIRPEVQLQGQSLVPMLKDPMHPGRGWALTQVSRGQPPNRFFGYSLRTERWRYTHWDNGAKGRELYDHQADPKELRNLAELPEFAAETQQLAEQLAEAVKTTTPPSGEKIEVKPGPWAPVWIDP